LLKDDELFVNNKERNYNRVIAYFPYQGLFSEAETMDFLKAAGNFANDLLELFGQTAKKLESPGRAINRDSVYSSIGEVSIPIEKGKQGEISVVLSGCLQSYPARALKADEHFPKGAKVRIADVGTNLLYIEKYQERQAPTRIEVLEPKDG
jgi:hypothetical protein